MARSLLYGTPTRLWPVCRSHWLFSCLSGVEIALHVHQEVAGEDGHGHHHNAHPEEHDEAADRLARPREVAEDPLTVEIDGAGPHGTQDGAVEQADVLVRVVVPLRNPLRTA